MGDIEIQTSEFKCNKEKRNIKLSKINWSRSRQGSVSFKASTELVAYNTSLSLSHL